MEIEEIKIEDDADANYVLRKFFKDGFKNIKMSQLEQLVLTVYRMGKNDFSSDDSPVSSDSQPPAKPVEPEVNPNPFKINDRAKAIEDIEIGHSGEFIKADTTGTVNSVRTDTVSFLFESGEFGEMIEASVPFDKLEKI